MDYLRELQHHLYTLRNRAGGVADAVRGLDAVLATHRDALPPQLVHYLVQRSYDKALLFVDATLAEQSGSGEAAGKEQSPAASSGNLASSPKEAKRGGSPVSRPAPPPGGCSGRSER